MSLELAELLDYHTVRDARLILTCGLPGAGKTALARPLAADRGAVRLTKDEWLWARIERDEMRSVARGLGVGVGVELHYLDVPADELWGRIDVRNAQPPWDSYPIRRANLDAWLALFQAPDAAELALFDPPPGVV